MNSLVNAYFKGGPFDGRIAKFPREKLAPDFVFNVNDTAKYKLLNGPVLDALQQGFDCDHLAITLEYVEDG